MRPIQVDEVLRQHLATQGLALDDIPAVSSRVTLRSNANLSTGGMATDVTSMCHPQVKAMAEHLAVATELATVGIDYLTTDITKSPSETGGAFIEMNTAPGLCMCNATGWSEMSIAKLVLGSTVGRIPVELSVLRAPADRALQKAINARYAQSSIAFVVGSILYM